MLVAFNACQNALKVLTLGRTKLASKNILFGLAGNIINTVLGFVSRAVFIQVLGVEILGIEAVFTNLIQMLSLAELGLTSVMTFSYYEPLAKNNTRKLQALISFYKKLYLGIALAVLIIGLAIIPFLPFIVNVEQNISNLIVFYLLFVADAVISYLFVYRTTILRADQKNYIITKYEIATSLVRTVFQIVVLVVFANYIAYLVVRIVSTLLWNFLSARKAKQLYPLVFQGRGTLEKEERLEILDILKSGFIYKVSVVFLNSTTNVILSIFVSTAIVGYLSNYNLIVVAVVQVSAIVFSNLTASIGNLVVLENEGARLSVFKSMVVVGSWISVVFVSCTTILCHSFISLWIGSGYTLSLSSEILRMIWMFLECVMQPIFAYREAVGLYRKTRYIMLFSAFLNVLFGCVLGYLIGIDGVLLGAILSRVMTYFWYEPKILYRDFFCSTPIPYFKEVVYAFLLTVILSTAGCVAVAYIGCGSWIMWLVQAIVIFVVINIVCIVVYRKNESLKNVVDALKNAKKES